MQAQSAEPPPSSLTPSRRPALTLLRRLLLLPLLAPLLAVLLLAALNPRPTLSLRLLTSRSPALPLGVWLAAGGSAGALLSGLATALALREGGRRQRLEPDLSRQPPGEPWFRPTWPTGGSGAEPEPEPSRRPAAEAGDWLQAGPQRAPGEPPPTVSVPFRVLKRPRRGSGASTAAAVAAPSSAAPARSAPGVTAEQTTVDDWDIPDEEDW